jgi:hypothetical protein
MNLSKRILRIVAFGARLDIVAGLTLAVALSVWMVLH